MSGEFKRRCRECPARTVAVCQHTFGKFWHDKSHGAEGCEHPMDEVAEAWYRAGWKPGQKGNKITLPLSDPAAFRPIPATPKRPVRPKRLKRQGGLL